MKNKDFAVFILTHGRPNNVITYRTLKKQGYTGDIYLVVDDLDDTVDEYIENFGKEVFIFDKQKFADKVDQGDNLNDLRTTTHVRNAIFELAKDLGITYFIALDDDYTSIKYRYIRDVYQNKQTLVKLDNYFDILLDFFIATPQITTICMSQGGDFIGGENCGMIQNYQTSCRKAMNSFICSTERPFQFFSRLNEDVNTYTTLGSRGVLFLTIPYVSVEQKQTQSNSGGMTDTYLDNGTYQKSFFTVMYNPSFVKISTMGVSVRRIHHLIDWKKAVPCIVSEKHKKK